MFVRVFRTFQHKILVQNLDHLYVDFYRKFFKYFSLIICSRYSKMLELMVTAIISGLSASIGAFLVSKFIAKGLKKDLKREILTFFSSEDAPKLFHAVGQSFGAGLFSRAGALNPMKGNINLMGFKIPKVLAYGLAQKYGFLPKGIMGEGEVAPASPKPSNILEKFK